MKKKYLALIGAICLTGTALIGGSMAAEYVESGNALEIISEKSLGVSIVSSSGETVKEDEKLGLSVTPGEEFNFNRQVKNTETNGYDLYTKVSIYYEWDKEGITDVAYENGDFVIFQKNGEEKISIPANASYETPQTVGDWIVAKSGAGEVVLYYTKPIAPGEAVTFVDGLTFSTSMNNQYAGATVDIYYEVEAVQANNSVDAIAAEWGVYPTVDENGVITKISQTRE